MLTGNPKCGDSPHFTRSIRKRGFNRALKAGKLWLIMSYKNADIVVFKLNISDHFLQFAKVIPDRNVPDDYAYITWPVDWVCATVQLDVK
jgi:hypothetical protein